MAGFEPASQGVKVPCLTTWLHLNISRADFGTVCRGRNLDECASNGIRTRELYILLEEARRRFWIKKLNPPRLLPA